MIRSTAGALVLVVVALAACKNVVPGRAERDRLLEFRDRMCRCRDAGCASEVADTIASWRRTHDTRGDFDPTLTSAIADLEGQIASCQTAATAVPGEPRAPAEPIFDADRIIKATFDGTGPELVIDGVELAFVGANGTLDATYGQADIELGRLPPPPPGDDPKRPLGAPVPQVRVDPLAMPTDCPRFTWKSGKRSRTTTGCMVITAYQRPRCTVVELWQRAIAAGAPAGALAVLELVPTRPQRWKFTIEDAPRNVHVEQIFEDDCQPVVEKP